MTLTPQWIFQHRCDAMAKKNALVHSLVHLRNARKGKYQKVISHIEKDGVCPFCAEHLHAYHKKPILRHGKHWLVTENMYPYKNTQMHFVLIHKQHIHSITGLSKEAWSELHKHLKWLLRRYNIPGGTALMRFGDHRYTGSSVTHLHAQLVVGKKGKRVITRI